MLQKLIPKIFYAHVDDALDLFVAGMGFAVRHRDDGFVVVERDGAKAYLVESAEYAAKDRPEIAIETDSLDELFAEISTRRPDLLHPNLAKIKTQSWGALEFALIDKTHVCVIYRQW